MKIVEFLDCAAWAIILGFKDYPVQDARYAQAPCRDEVKTTKIQPKTTVSQLWQAIKSARQEKPPQTKCLPHKKNRPAAKESAPRE